MTTAGGISATASADRFTYVTPPTVTAINPTGGSIAGGTSVSITGTSLSSASGVKFGTTAGTITANSATSITATAPAESAGTVDVTVTTLAGTSALSSADRFTYAAAPTVTALESDQRIGHGWHGGDDHGYQSLRRHGSQVRDYRRLSDRRLSHLDHRHRTGRGGGTVDVTVTTPGGTSATSSADHYTFATAPPPTPTVVGTNPSSGPTAGGTAVTITGTNLSGATSVSFGSSSGVITADSATSITATAPAEAAATVDVTVTTPGGTSPTSSADHYTFVAPVPPGAPYSPLAPVRICDTRAGNPSASPERPLSATGTPSDRGDQYRQRGRAGSFGVPANATAVVLNVTVVNPVAPGFVTAYPTGATCPMLRTSTTWRGQVVPNLVEVGIGTDGDVSFFSLASRTWWSTWRDTLADGVGRAGAGLYNALASPVRICDTRAGNPSNLDRSSGQPVQRGGQPTVRPSTRAPRSTWRVAGANPSDVIPAGATAAVFNVTVANPIAQGFLTVFPEDKSRPLGHLQCQLRGGPGHDQPGDRAALDHRGPAGRHHDLQLRPPPM